MTVSVMTKENDVREEANRTDLAILVTDPQQPDNPITYASAGITALTGYTPDLIVGQNCRILQGQDTDPRDVERLAAVVATGGEIELTLLNYRADGTAFHNCLTVAPLQDADGRLTGHLGVLRRVDGPSEAKGAHALDTTAMLQEFQHRVKNHLAMIVSMIRMQARDQASPTAFRELSHRIETLALLYDQINAAESNSMHQMLDLPLYLERIARAIEGIEGRPGIEVVLNTAPVRQPAQRCARIGLILSELLTNAFKHAFRDRTEGHVAVSLEALSGDYLRLTIEDDGVGLPKGTGWPSGESGGGIGGRILVGLTSDLEARVEVGTALRGTRVAVDIPPETGRTTG